MPVPGQPVQGPRQLVFSRLFQVCLHLLLIFDLTELYPGLYKGCKFTVQFAVLRSVSKVYLQGEDTTVTIHHVKISCRDLRTSFCLFSLSRVSFGWPYSLTCLPSSPLPGMSLCFKHICLISRMCLVPHISQLPVCCSLLPSPSSHQNHVFLVREAFDSKKRRRHACNPLHRARVSLVPLCM